MSVQLTDGTNSVPVDATSKGLVVQNPKIVGQAGYVSLGAVRDSGSIVGAANAQSSDITIHNRLRVGLETPIFQDVFNYTAQNFNLWASLVSTMTQTWTTGFTVLNAGGSVATTVYANTRTYKSFPLLEMGGVVAEWKALYTQTPQVNNLMTMGFSTISVTTAAPTDGIYFQFDATGTLKAVVANNGVYSTSGALTAPTNNTIATYRIIIDYLVAEFWINGVLVWVATLPTGSATTQIGSSAYLMFQNTNGGSAPSLAQILKIAVVNVWQLDENSAKPYPHIQASMGLTALQGQSGGTVGSTELYANSGNPTAAVPTNTTAALGSGLGGNFWETATLAVNTDAIISSYQNPAGSIAAPMRNLYITGIRWSSMVQTVLAGGPFVYQCGIAYGHTAVSLATADGAATKAPRRFAMGLYTLPATAAVGTAGANFVHTFTTPIMIQPGEFIQTIVRNIGTVGTSGTIAHVIGLEGYWE